MTTKQPKRNERIRPEEGEIADPHPNDMVILILGGTRSGKSTFINTLTNGKIKLHVGDVDTQFVEPVAVSHPEGLAHRVIFLDTPGLDKEGGEILEHVLAWLQKSYQNGMKLAGIIFMYKISQARDLSWALGNVDYFQKLCGDRATRNVIIATTKWRSPPTRMQLEREKVLEESECWGQVAWRGSRMCRLEDTSFEAAWDLVDCCLADAFTFDTEKIQGDVQQMKDSWRKKGHGAVFIAALERLLESQNRMAKDLKLANGVSDIMWSQLVENDKRIREALRQADTRVTLLQRIRIFFTFTDGSSATKQEIPSQESPQGSRSDKHESDATPAERVSPAREVEHGTRPEVSEEVLQGSSSGLNSQLKGLESNRPPVKSILPSQSLDNLKGLVPLLDSIFTNVPKYRRLLRFRDSEAQKLLDIFQILLDSSGLTVESRHHLLVATQRLSSSAGLYPAWFKLEGVDSPNAHFVTDGSFADIYKCKFLNHNVCLKVMRFHRMAEMRKFLKQFSSEAILWGLLEHPNILPVYGMCDYQKRPCLVSPWMENGDINDFLEQHPTVNRKLLALDIALGIGYLHDLDIVHGDLKGANILVDGSGRARVGDFGLSSISNPRIPHWSTRSAPASKGGTLRWQAPELLEYEYETPEPPSPKNDHHLYNTKASDIYAFACVLYEIFTGNPPFFEYKGFSFVTRVQAGEKPSRPQPSSPAWNSWGLTEPLWLLMHFSWNMNPNGRPTINQILSLDELQGLQDDRPTDTLDNDISPLRFRQSMYAQSELPCTDEIESLLYGIQCARPSAT